MVASSVINAMKDIRWKQRLENFSRSLGLMEQALARDELSEIERAGLIQFFEMTFELGWNTLKDYLEAEGFQDVRTPRKAIKKAFETGLIGDAEDWLQGLEDRNLTSHTYKAETAREVEQLIRRIYFPLFIKLGMTFNDRD